MKKLYFIAIVLIASGLSAFMEVEVIYEEQAVYGQTKIGKQIWMTENLNVDKFRNGDPIPHAKTDEEWKRANENGEPAWCYFENKPDNGEKYGKLYNWFAVNDSRGLAPKGWHVPSYDEWNYLYELLGGINNKKGMKSVNGWKADGGKNDNSSGFSALPGGCRIHWGKFSVAGEFTFWWSSEGRQMTAFGVTLNSDDYARIEQYDKGDGLSVRCIKDK